MKKRVRGLFALLQVMVIMFTMMPMNVFAANSMTFYVYVNEGEPLSANDYCLVSEFVQVLFESEDVTIGEATADVSIPEHYEVIGWKMWKTTGSGNVVSDTYTEKTNESTISYDGEYVPYSQMARPLLETILKAKEYEVPVYSMTGDAEIGKMVYTIENKDTITFDSVEWNEEGVELLTGADTSALEWIFAYDEGLQEVTDASVCWDLITSDEVTNPVFNVSLSGEATVEMPDYVYGEDEIPQPVITTTTNDTDKVKFFYKAADDENAEETEEAPTKAGKYEVKAYFYPSGIYGMVLARNTFTVTEAELKITFSSDTYTPGQKDDFYAKCNGGLSYFEGKILMDGKEVDAKNYTVTEGSTIITFSKDYLDSLEGGKHVLTMQYAMGDVEGSFTIATSENAETGDTSSMGWLYVIMAVSLMAVIFVNKKKNFE